MPRKMARKKRATKRRAHIPRTNRHRTRLLILTAIFISTIITGAVLYWNYQVQQQENNTIAFLSQFPQVYDSNYKYEQFASVDVRALSTTGTFGYKSVYVYYGLQNNYIVIKEQYGPTCDIKSESKCGQKILVMLTISNPQISNQSSNVRLSYLNTLSLNDVSYISLNPDCKDNCTQHLYLFLATYAKAGS